MFAIIPTYIVFALAAGVLHRLAPARWAIVATFLGGWMILPVGIFPESPFQTVFPYWLVGIALPSDMLINKAWVTAVTALFWALAFDWKTATRFRPHWIDLPMLLWCAWPLLAASAWTNPDPHPLVSSAYLLGSWGALWLLGRIWFADWEGQVVLLKGLALVACAAVPVAWFEAQSLMAFHAILYGEHPNRLDGVVRPVGYRAVGFFEHGNQYSLWVSLAAVAAVWLAVSRPAAGTRWIWVPVALLALVLGVVHQSRGAILLLLVGIALLTLWRFRLGYLLVSALALGSAAFFALHYSGALWGWLMAEGLIPRDALERGSAGAREMRRMLGEFGLGTFGYRIWQDMETRNIVLISPLFGQGQWDWWREAGTRPWGFWVLTAGQFGAIGSGLALVALAVPTLGCLLRMGRVSPWSPTNAAIPLGIVVLLGLIDATQNSFLFFPALLGAGALASHSIARPQGLSSESSNQQRVET